MKLSVVIPFYNEENMIQKMYDELVKDSTFRKVSSISKNTIFIFFAL